MIPIQVCAPTPLPTPPSPASPPRAPTVPTPPPPPNQELHDPYTEQPQSKLLPLTESELHNPPKKHLTSKHVPSNASEHSDPHTEKPQCQHILPTKLEFRPRHNPLSIKLLNILHVNTYTRSPSFLYG